MSRRSHIAAPLYSRDHIITYWCVCYTDISPLSNELKAALASQLMTEVIAHPGPQATMPQTGTRGGAQGCPPSFMSQWRTCIGPPKPQSSTSSTQAPFCHTFQCIAAPVPMPPYD